MQNKGIRFLQRLDKMHYTSEKNCGFINQLPTSKGVNECINNVIFKFFHDTCPYYLKEIFEFAPHCRIVQEINFQNLKFLH